MAVKEFEYSARHHNINIATSRAGIIAAARPG
jgi:hypothetical protein